MATKYNYLGVFSNNKGEIITLFYSNGIALNINTGKAIETNYKVFSTIVKNHNGKITKKPNLKFGEYININTGKIEKLYGI